MFFTGVNVEVRRAPGLPLIEFSALVAEIKIKHLEVFYLQLAMKFVEIVQKYDGLLVPPFGDIPEDKNIFFTAQFKSFNDVENFLKELDAIGF